MSTDNRNRVTKGVSAGGQFAPESKTEDSSVSLTGTAPPTDLQRAMAALAEYDKPRVERGPDGTINELVCQHGERTFTVEANDERFEYSIYEDQEEVAYFTAAEGSVTDEDELWKESLEELQASGVAESCSECSDTIDDGEGYDGKCGNCADREYAAEQEDEDEAFCPKCKNLLEEGVDCEHCGPDAEISRFVEQYDDFEVTVVREGYMDGDNYEVRDDQGNEILTFTHSGDTEDHSAIWDTAKAALDERAASAKGE